MVEVIHEHLAGYGSVVDVGCGAGQYGKALGEVATDVFGIDHDATLCDAARATGTYRQVVCAPVADVASHFPDVDAVFCSELLEHIPPPDLRDVIDAIEAAPRRRMVVTVPNPRSPHYRYDPTHVGVYTVRSMLRTLGESGPFAYRLLPLGFSDLSLTDLRWTRALQPLSRRVASLSPTVLYVGDRVR
jgi:SAM-dependent methyltransferase